MKKKIKQYNMWTTTTTIGNVEVNYILLQEKTKIKWGSIKDI